MNSRSQNPNSSAVDRDAEEQLLQHISALHARLSVGVEKLITPLRDQIIAYKEVVAPLSQDLKKNLAVSWPLIEELQKHENALHTAIGDINRKLSGIEEGIAAFGPANQAGGEAIEALSAQTAGILDAIQPLSDRLATVESGLNAPLDDLGGRLDTANSTLASLSGILQSFAEDRQSADAALQGHVQQIAEAQSQFSAALGEYAENQTGARSDVQALAADLQSLTADVHTGISALTQSVTALSEATTSDIDSRLDSLRGELDAGVTAISQAISALGEANQTNTQDDFEALKFEVQSGISTIYSGIVELRDKLASAQDDTVSSGIQDIQARLSDLEAMKSGLTALHDTLEGRFDHTAERFSVLAAQLSELQSREDNSQTEEVRAQVSKLDWAIQSIGQNVAALGNKLASIQEDVATPPMARRTLKSIEDVDHQVGQILRTLEQKSIAPAASPSGAVVAAPALDPVQLESVHAELARTQSLLSEIGGQLSDALKHYSRDIRQAVSDLGPAIPAAPAMESPRSAIEARLAALEATALQNRGWFTPHDGTPPAPIDGYDGSTALDQLKALDPVTFEHWIGPFRAAADIYANAPSDNCSTLASPMGRAFRDYLSLFAKGDILDIGCGPHGDPVYLQGYPASRLSALEPLDLIGTPELNIVRGVNEFLPWPDNAFSTVVNATAIDHVLDLERSLEETRRVLKQDGVFVIWYANVPGSADYTLKAPADRAPVDGAHLFHVSEDWFLPLMDRYFELADIRHFSTGSDVSDVFAVFRPRKTVKSRPEPATSDNAPRSKAAKSGRRKTSPSKKRAASSSKTSAAKPESKPASTRKKPTPARTGRRSRKPAS